MAAAASWAAPVPPAAAAPPSERFSADNAARSIRMLSEEIGPRKTGTPGEASARDTVERLLRQAGLEVTRQPVGRVGADIVGSENIVGILPGSRDGSIVIGAHHDTKGRDVPGANDNASGVAVMLEAARVLAADPPSSRLVFVSFCAEEEGLLGAASFAAGPDASRVVAAVNLDSVGWGRIVAAPFPSAPPLWAQRALERVARAERIDGAGIDPLHVLASRLIEIPFGADHKPFLENGIPAVTLAGELRPWSYHTRQDLPAAIDRGSLEAAGRTLIGLVRRLDEAPPPRAGVPDPRYAALPLFGRTFFVLPLSVHVLGVLTALLALLWWRSVAVRRGRRFRPADAGLALARAALPLACATAGALLSEGMSQALTGFRFSWTAHQGHHLAQAATWAAAGLALGWTALPRLPAPREAEAGMLLAAGAWAGAGLALLAAGLPDLAFYALLPAAGTLGASLVRPGAAGLGALAGCLPALVLITPRSYSTLVHLLGLSIPWAVAGPALPVLLAPLALGLARTFGAPRPRVAAAAAAVLASAAAGQTLLNAGRPAYDDRHRRLVTVEERIGPDGRPVARLTSVESLRGIRTSLPDRPRIHTAATRLELTLDDPAWLSSAEPEVAVLPGRPDGWEDLRRVEVTARPPTVSDETIFTIRTSEPVDGVGADGVRRPGSVFRRRHVASEGSPREEFHLDLPEGARATVEVRTRTGEDLFGLRLEADHTVFRWESRLQWKTAVPVPASE